MSSNELHAGPAWTAVIAEQWRSVGLRVRKDAIIASSALLVFSAWFIGMHLTRWERTESIDVELGFAFPLALASFLVPLAIWRDETPERRTYLWSLPVDRGRHHLTKLAMGWGWLMVAVAALMLWLHGMALATGGESGTETVRFFVGLDRRNIGPEDFVSYTFSNPPWQWLIPFAGATVAYLIGSVVALASNHPGRWFAGAVVALVLLHVTADGESPSELSRFVLQHVIGFDRWGDVANPYALLQTIRPVDPVMENVPGAGERLIPRLDLGMWLTATSVWLGVGLVGTSIAAFRHREP